MQNTHFVNASGLPDSRQISTARDIAILSRAVMRDYPQYYKLFSLQEFTFRGQVMANHNHLLGRMPGVDGLKTGFTNASGFNLAVSAVRDNRRLIAVVMGGPTTAQRDQNAEDLLLTGFDVMRRRALGEKIVVAQNQFEPSELNGPVVRAPTEQGDGDQASLKIELASAPAAKAGKVEIAPTRRGGKAKWAVQVGEFRSKADAHRQIALVEKKFGDHFDSARGAAEKAGGRYKAVFTGFAESDARDACHALKAKRLACIVIEPT
jgi:D-alanyl-D-alanine carboxypeptidase (penicillin-binding protein 5/6)